MTQKLIIDTDPGIDDAMAIHLAFADSRIDVIGMTTIFGMSQPRRRHATRYIWPKWPIMTCRWPEEPPFRGTVPARHPPILCMAMRALATCQRCSQLANLTTAMPPGSCVKAVQPTLAR